MATDREACEADGVLTLYDDIEIHGNVTERDAIVIEDTEARPSVEVTWKHYFFVRIDSASVEESCIPFFQSRWGRKENNILPSFPENLPTVRDILRGGPYFRGHFSLECVHRAMAYNRSRLQPDLPVEEESKSDMEEFVPYDILGEKERSRSPKNKQIAVDSCDSGAINRLECPTDEMFCNFLNSQASGSGTNQTDM
ncbi:hypothetical protein DY000_02021876 [Brassica cretica]|uniref:Uncharacterized protein n=1 Tax=Brassica cretica TaxID=69181 RepID=A0ABQ7ECT4_BRACR|nr:hypothetical protein DY000_02021876 [Brassica cretica]